MEYRVEDEANGGGKVSRERLECLSKEKRKCERPRGSPGVCGTTERKFAVGVRGAPRPAPVRKRGLDITAARFL